MYRRILGEGIFIRRRGARARLEQAQQRFDEVRAAGIPNQGQIPYFQTKMSDYKGLVASASGEQSQLMEA